MGYFQQDGATAHAAWTTTALLRELFSNHLITRKAKNLWPPSYTGRFFPKATCEKLKLLEPHWYCKRIKAKDYYKIHAAKSRNQMCLERNGQHSYKMNFFEHHLFIAWQFMRIPPSKLVNLNLGYNFTDILFWSYLNVEVKFQNSDKPTLSLSCVCNFMWGNYVGYRDALTQNCLRIKSTDIKGRLKAEKFRRSSLRCC